MYFRLLLIFSFFLNLNYAHAQNKCGTIDTELEEWIATWEKFGGRPQDNPVYLQSRASINIPMHYHVVRDDNGANGYPLNFLYELHCDLNRNYSKSGVDIQFYLDTVSYINSTKYFDLLNSEEFQLTSAYNTLKHCNVYLLFSPAGNCGYTYRPRFGATPASRSAIFLQASRNNYSCTVPGSTTLSHEMGHWLDLPHTFFGWEGSNYTGSPIPKNRWENVARSGTGSNCKNRGDLFCDTDPDYISGRWNCPSSSQYTDAVGATFIHKGINYMSYSNDECMYEFTTDQKTQMIAAMSSFNERKDLLNLPTPNLNEIDSIHNYFPAQNTSNNIRVNTENLFFSWSGQPQATSYVVTLAKGNSTYNSNFSFNPGNMILDTMIQDTILAIPSALFGTGTNNNFYYWSVRAVNKLSCCGDNAIAKQAFKVGTLNVKFNNENPLCPGEFSGKIDVDNINNITGLEYFFDSQTSSSSTFFDLSAGNYEIGVKSNGVTYLHNIALTNPKAIECTTTINTDGKVTILAKNGKPPYTYKWPNNKSGATQTGLANGDYKVTITDDNGCTLTDYKVKVSSSTNSIKDAEKEVFIFPNIVNYGTQIKISNIESILNNELNIYDIIGNLVEKIHTETNPLDFNFIWNIKTSGIYFIKFKSNHLDQIFKIQAN